MTHSKIVKKILAGAIIGLVAASATIPVFAFGSSFPDADFVYYCNWQFGGNGQYNAVKQCDYNYGILRKGTQTYINFRQQKASIKGDCKMTTYKAIPTSVTVPSYGISASYKLMKQSGASWVSVPLSNGKDNQKFGMQGYKIPRYLTSSTFNAGVATLSANTLPATNYQFDIQTEFVPQVLKEYINFEVQFGVDKVK